MIDVEKLSKTYGTTRALDSLDLHLERGLAYGIVGPNGSGKTTLFRILTGLLRADVGTVRVLGTSPDRLDRARIGYMPQNEALYGDLSVRENVRFFASIAGLTGPTLARRIDDILAVTHLTPFADRLVEHLSGGMARRASLSCAIAHDPDLIFLDEPTVGVDPKLRIEFWEYFSKLQQRGATLLVSTHHLDEASRCDELVLMRNGRLLAKATPANVLSSTGSATVEEAFLKLSNQESA